MAGVGAEAGAVFADVGVRAGALGGGTQPVAAGEAGLDGGGVAPVGGGRFDGQAGPASGQWSEVAFGQVEGAFVRRRVADSRCQASLRMTKAASSRFQPAVGLQIAAGGRGVAAAVLAWLVQHRFRSGVGALPRVLMV